MELKENSVHSIICDTEELNFIKTALHLLHECYKDAMKDEVFKKEAPEEYQKDINEMIKVEFMCQELKIPGYEFS